MDRRFDNTADGGLEQLFLRIPLVARPLSVQWARAPLAGRARTGRAVDPHRPGTRSRRRGDRGILPGLQPASVSGAGRRFQGRPAGNFASGLKWKLRRAALHWFAYDVSHGAPDAQFRQTALSCGILMTRLVASCAGWPAVWIAFNVPHKILCGRCKIIKPLVSTSLSQVSRFI